MTTYAKQVFDEAIELKPGQSILFSTSSRGHMNSLRVLLSRERKRFLERINPEFDIIISTKVISSNYHVIITKSPLPSAPVLISSDGEVIKTLDMQQQPPVEVVTATAEEMQDKERIAALMRQDGISEEEIEDYFRSEPEDLGV